jgi:hypothetical protein
MKRLAGLSLMLIVGCATPYQSKGYRGGFSETQLTPDVFRVSFRGNGYTSGERAEDFAMLRAAELSLTNGYNYFALIDETSSTTTQSYTTADESHTTGAVSTYGNNAVYSSSTTHTPGQTYTFYKPGTGLLVRGYKTKPNGIFTFDAEFLQQSLKKKYGIE